MNRKILSLILIVFAFATFPIQRVSGTYTLPPETKVQAYVNTLIESYHTLVQSSFGPYPNSTIKAHFWLWHDPGITFKVLVIQQGNVSGYVMMVFFPIAGNYPQIVLNDTIRFSDIFPVNICCASDEIFQNDTVFYPNLYSVLNVGVGQPSSLIVSDNGNNATWIAQQIYNMDMASLPHPKPQLTPDQGPQPLGWFNENPVVKTLNSLAGILAVIGIALGAFLVIKRKQVKEKLGMGQPPKHPNKN